MSWFLMFPEASQKFYRFPGYHSDDNKGLKNTLNELVSSQTLYLQCQHLVNYRCSLFSIQGEMSSIPILNFSLLLIECPVVSTYITTLPFLLEYLYSLFLNTAQIEINTHILLSLVSMSFSFFPYSTAEPKFNTHDYLIVPIGSL